SPADVAANDLKIDDTVRKYLKETPIDRIKPAAKWLFTTPQGRLLLYASLAAGAGGLYWLNYNTVNAAVGSAATWVADKATGAYGAIKDAIMGADVTKTTFGGFIPISSTEHVPGAIENATNWWQNTAQPAIGTAAQKTGEFAFGNADTGARGALYNAAYTVRAIPPTVEMAGRQAAEPNSPILMGLGATVETAKAVASEISKGWQDAAKLVPVPLP
ncbi:MAG: hypothetical protein NUV52_02285, partial [Candidatus Roizmanbacteria bacterium]|nr:hypothetical protein [Candidatus Roizmanbacteria bacterium]